MKIHVFTGCPEKNDALTLSHNFWLNYQNSKFEGGMYIVMSNKCRTLWRKLRSIWLSSSENMSDYVTHYFTHFQNLWLVLFGTPCITCMCVSLITYVWINRLLTRKVVASLLWMNFHFYRFINCTRSLTLWDVRLLGRHQAVSNWLFRINGFHSFSLLFRFLTDQKQ